MEASNLARTKAPRTQCEDQEAVVWIVGRLVERADVLGDETWCVGIVLVPVRPVELLVEAIGGIDGGPFASDEMRVPVRADSLHDVLNRLTEFDDFLTGLFDGQPRLGRLYARCQFGSLLKPCQFAVQLASLFVFRLWRDFRSRSCVCSRNPRHFCSPYVDLYSSEQSDWYCPRFRKLF